MARSAGPRRRRRGAVRHGAILGGLLVGLGLLLVAVAASVVAGPVAGASVNRRAAPPTTCTYPARQNQVLVVIDFGDVADVPGTRPAQDVTTVCVVVPDGARSNLALQLALDQLGWERTLSGIGMLCSVGGYPASGCGDPSGTNYLYWSYWWGVDGNWSYSGVGPATSVAKCGKVEGWRFINGAAQVGVRQSPRGSARAQGMCAPTTTTTSPSPVTLPPSAPGGPTAPGGGTTPGQSGAHGGSGGSTSGSSARSTTVPGEGSDPDDPAHGTPRDSAAEHGPGADGGTAPGPAGAWADVQTPEERRAATAIPEASNSNGVHPVLKMGGSAAVVAAVGLLGMAQTRRRRFG